MSNPTGENVYRAVGRLAFNCTDFSLPFPHGGTALGTTARVLLDPGDESWPEGAITAEEKGGRSVEILKLANNPILTASIRGWDDDALALFWETITGGTQEVITLPGSNRNGYQRSRDAVKVTFSAFRASHPSVHLYRAVPVVDEDSSLALQLVRETGYVVNFIGLDNDAGNAGQMGLLGDLTV